MTSGRLPICLCAALLTACGAPRQPAVDGGVLWVQYSAEYRAIAAQTYRDAGDDLDAMLADPSWSALPGQRDAAGLPPAIILDVDDTVVSNVEFQRVLEPPFSEEQFTAWLATNEAAPVPGVVDFVTRARERGVEIFFVTNRACMVDPVTGEDCPQEAVTLQDIREAGLSATPERVMLSFEQPGWNKEKKNRRDVIARDYRVIMLVGDDLGDFIPCTRAGAVSPCDVGATVESRARAVDEHADYWSNGWYLLPNPMYGSWTTVR